jgi:cadmium resistance protein CadD (predicted permease)
MRGLLSTIGIGIVVFASTNIDEMVVLSAFFADMRLSRRAIIVGKFLQAQHLQAVCLRHACSR